MPRVPVGRDECIGFHSIALFPCIGTLLFVLVPLRYYGTLLRGGTLQMFLFSGSVVRLPVVRKSFPGWGGRRSLANLPFPTGNSLEFPGAKLRKKVIPPRKIFIF